VTAEVFYDEMDWVGNAITFELTSHGLAHYTQIIGVFYEYMALLLQSSSLSEIALFYRQQQCMQQLRFKFYSLIQQRPYDIVSAIARRMQSRDTPDWLYTALNVIPPRCVYDAELMQRLLQFMSQPEHVVIYKLSSNTGDDASSYARMEPFFGIEFNATRISGDTLWQSTAVGVVVDSAIASIA